MAENGRRRINQFVEENEGRKGNDLAEKRPTERVTHLTDSFRLNVTFICLSTAIATAYLFIVRVGTIVDFYRHRAPTNRMIHSSIKVSFARHENRSLSDSQRETFRENSIRDSARIFSPLHYYLNEFSPPLIFSTLVSSILLSY